MIAYTVIVAIAVLALLLAGSNDALGLETSDSGTRYQIYGNVSVIPVLTDLEAPWDVAFGDNGWMYVSTRPGVLYGMYEGNVTNLLNLRVSGGEGGMLGIATLGDMLYIYHTDPENGNKISRYIHGESGLSYNTTIIENIPAGAYHDGGRIRFGPDSMLYVTTGDAGRNVNSWLTSSLAGKILRLNPDGSIPSDNPFPDSPVYAYGLRNPQGLAWDWHGNLYATDHGTSGQDEINLIIAGGNYGWPFSRGDRIVPNTLPPLIHSGNDTWAPSGLVFAGTEIPQWEETLLYGALRGEHLGIVRTDGSGHNMAYAGEFGRIRTPIKHPNGTLYLLTSNNDGRGTPNAGDDKLLRLEYDVYAKAQVTASTPVAGEDIVVTITLDAAAPIDNHFIVQLYRCDQNGYIKDMNLCSGDKTVTYDDIVSTYTPEPGHPSSTSLNLPAGILDIKNGTTTGTLSFGTTHDGDEDQESLIISVAPRVDKRGWHPFYSFNDRLKLAWVDLSTPFVGGSHGFAYWKTSILPSPDQPQVVEISGLHSVNEGDSIPIFIDAKPAPSSPLDINVTIAQVGNFVNSKYIGSQTITLHTNGSASMTIPIDNDIVDILRRIGYSSGHIVTIPTIDNNIVGEPDGRVTVTLNQGLGYKPASSKTWSVGVYDDDDGKPVAVSLTAAKTSIFEGGKGNFTIKLNRQLEPGETVTVPFDVEGGTTPEHWSVSLSEYSTGAELTASGAKPVVVFTRGGQTAMLVLTVNQDSDAVDHALTVSLGTGDRRPTSIGVAGGTILGDVTSLTIDIIDDDKPAPTINIQGDNPVRLSVGGQYVDAGATCTDHTKSPITPTVNGSVNTLVPSTYTIHYSCADDTGKKSSAARIVVIQDTAPPTLTIPNVSAEATGPSTPVDIGFPTIQDASGGPYIITHNATGTPQTATSDVTVSLAVGTHTIQWNATDASHNTGTTHQTVSVSDTTPPTLTLNGKALVYILVEDTYTDAGATCTDSVDGTLKPVVQSNVDISGAGQYTIQYTCLDTRGNAAPPVSRIVSVDDATPPVLSISDVSAEATGPATPVNLGFPLVQDASGGPYIITHNATGIPQTATSSVTTPLAIGTYTIQWNATDISSNTGTTHQTVSVDDATPPVLSISNVSTEATGPSTPVDIGFPTIQDNSGGPYTITHNATGTPQTATSDVTVSLAVGTHTIQWNATDASHNTGTTHQTVSVSDTTPPTLTLNGKASISIPMGSTYTDAGAACTDSVDGTIKPTLSGNVNSSIRDTYTVTYTCTDTARNSASPVTRTVQIALPTIMPTVSITGDTTAVEGSSLDFVISLNHPYAQAIDVYYITLDGGAIAGSDYTFAHDFVRFNPGSIEHTVSIETTADDILEDEEEMYFEITYAVGAKISEKQWVATGTISDP